MPLLPTSLLLPLLLILSIPLTLFALLTSTLAASILLLRVLAIYIELLLTILPSYLLPSPTPLSPPLAKRRVRRNSSSAGSITPTASTSLLNVRSVVGLSDMGRDFEGVGGWKFGEEGWEDVNGRLELPAEHGRRHRRSATGGMEIGMGRERGEGVGMNMGRTRTPSKEDVVMGIGQSPKAGRRTTSFGTGGSEISKGSGVSMKGK